MSYDNMPHHVTRRTLLTYHSVLLDRVKSVEADIEKLSSGNATLQMYIDNLTMQMAKRR